MIQPLLMIRIRPFFDSLLSTEINHKLVIMFFTSLLTSMRQGL